MSLLLLPPSIPSHSFTDLLLCSQGFDEFMNIVLDEAAEVYVKDVKPRKELGSCQATSQPILY